MTDTMPDGNSAALRQHEASQARAEARYDAYGERAIQSVVDEVLSGGVLRKVFTVAPRDKAPADFILDDGVEMWLDHEDLASLITGNAAAREQVINKLRVKLAATVREWCESSPAGSALIDERVRATDEDARTRYRESDQ